MAPVAFQWIVWDQILWWAHLKAWSKLLRHKAGKFLNTAPWISCLLWFLRLQWNQWNSFRRPVRWLQNSLLLLVRNLNPSRVPPQRRQSLRSRAVLVRIESNPSQLTRVSSLLSSKQHLLPSRVRWKNRWSVYSLMTSYLFALLPHIHLCQTNSWFNLNSSKTSCPSLSTTN